MLPSIVGFETAVIISIICLRTPDPSSGFRMRGTPGAGAKNGNTHGKRPKGALHVAGKQGPGHMWACD